MNIEVLHDRVILEKIDLEWKTESGLFLGPIEKERENNFGKVLAVGPGKQLDGTGIVPTKVKVGDLITFNDRMAIPVSYKGKILFSLRENEIYFVIKDEDFTVRDFQTEGDDFERSNISRNLK